MADSIKENEHDIHKVNDNNDDDLVNQDSFEKDTTINFHTTEGSSPSQDSSNSATTAPSPQNTIQQQESSTIQRSAPESKFFAVRTSGGQEHVVANILQNKVNTKKIRICSILVLDSFKGYIIVEAPDSNVAYEALSGIRHVRGQIRGELPFKDIERYLVKKPVVSELNVDDTVEVVAGPFKSMKAKITRVDYEKQEATVVLLDSPYQIPVTVDANYLKKLMH
jgi:transcription termination/antitermination protein NusG